MEKLPCCPRCGRDGLVRHQGSDRLSCVYCSYERNLAEAPAEGGRSG